jgi:hypothetical protein
LLPCCVDFSCQLAQYIIYCQNCIHDFFSSKIIANRCCSFLLKFVFFFLISVIEIPSFGWSRFFFHTRTIVTFPLDWKKWLIMTSGVRLRPNNGWEVLLRSRAMWNSFYRKMLENLNCYGNVSSNRFVSISVLSQSFV